MSKPFFLAKAGQIHGPYDRSEIESLRESGQYEKYTWFWDEALSRWQPIDPPPAPPRGATQPSAQIEQGRGQAHIEAQSKQLQPEWSVSEERLRSISAICHDHHSVVTGTLANVTDAGCEFLVVNRSTSPDFQAKLPVLLHLLDLPTGHSMNVPGRIGRVERRDGAWVYRIHWKRCPQLLSERAPATGAEASGR